ncbi:MAG TPA: VOC family protein, partial [Bacteroidia bacterium]|nr:VOC family protein [Bacteroidia bacterium]
MAAKKTRIAKSKTVFTALQVYFYVRSMDRSVDFYTKTLGFPLRVRFGNFWAEVDAGPVTIGLHPGKKGKAKPEEGGILSLGVKDIENVYTSLKEKKVKVGKMHTPDRGKFFMITDPDGYELHVVEFDPKWKKANR